MSNSSSISHFLLLALADTRQLQLLHFCLLLGISLAALLGNGLIISAVACDHHLHTPMFFFLLNLALSDLGCIGTTVPKAMHNSLWDTRDISYTGCAAQFFLFYFFISMEFSLLTIMCYDRYVSICKPLHYGTLLGSRACAHMAAAAWASAFLNALLHTANTFSLPLCHGNALGQFFCEIPQILKLSCSKSYLRELGLIALSSCLALGCFVFIVFSYVQIFRAVLRIPSEQGRHKAFSTCLPHLAVVSLFISTSFFTYLKPPSMSSPSLDLALSVLYSVVPPALNPLIYSLRNQELKAAVRRLMTGWLTGLEFPSSSFQPCLGMGSHWPLTDVPTGSRGHWGPGGKGENRDVSIAVEKPVEVDLPRHCTRNGSGLRIPLLWPPALRCIPDWLHSGSHGSQLLTQGDDVCTGLHHLGDSRKTRQSHYDLPTSIIAITPRKHVSDNPTPGVLRRQRSILHHRVGCQTSPLGFKNTKLHMVKKRMCHTIEVMRRQHVRSNPLENMHNLSRPQTMLSNSIMDCPLQLIQKRFMSVMRTRPDD
ncbi:olfactory receptor 14J1-like [Zonotrichia albicollis]|uniref:olfactory receptor 14J1-like n=1 Tax=Zonotrichia albicollis TaxID=44394 RepID=UPI003D80F9BF